MQALLGNEPGDLSAVVAPPLQTWYQTGIETRISDALTDASKLEIVFIEYFNWAALAALLGSDVEAGLADEIDSGRDLLTTALRASVDASVLLALNAGNTPSGDEAAKAIELARLAEQTLLIAPDDDTHSVSAIVDQLGFEVVVTDADIDGDFGNDSTLELVVDAHVEINGLVAELEQGLPIRLNPLGRNTVGNTSGSIIDGQFRTPIRAGRWRS